MIEQYHVNGLSALPAITAQRRPAIGGWKEFQSRIPSADDVAGWNTGDGVCLVCGTVSGNLEMIDFDLAGESFAEWRDRVPAELYARLVVERSQSGGYHVAYRCGEPVEGNMKLCSREVKTPTADEIEVCGKSYKPRPDGEGGNHVVLTQIETRGEGGLFLCDPSPGYTLEQGSFTGIETITANERATLLDAARAMNSYRPIERTETRKEAPALKLIATNSGATPGDDYNENGDVLALLLEHGWTENGKTQDGITLTRPGKTRGASASLCDGALYVFSSNAPPFEPDEAYSPFATYALLRCGGDYVEAGRMLRSEGYGGAISADLGGVDLSGIMSPQAASKQPVALAVEGEVEVDPFEALTLDEIMLAPLDEPVIHGLLRRGETMNLIAAPKTGKSWVASNLAISVATGCEWLGMEVEPGRVLHIDNELKRNTLAFRYHQVADAIGMPVDVFGPNVTAVSLRGKLKDLTQLAPLLARYPRGHFAVVIVDALYRCLPAGTDENDNASMAGVYNLIDNYAAAMGSAFVLVHHTSKGNQIGKAVTDVGSGAGSQSRAADTHIALRPTEDGSAIILDAVARTFPPVDPIALKFEWPLFHPMQGVNIDALMEQGTGKPAPVTVEEYVECVIDGELSLEMLMYQSKQAGISDAESKRLLAVAQEKEMVERVKGAGGKMVYRRV